MKKTLILITALATIIYGCAKEEEFDYNAGSVVPVVQDFSGPSSATANGFGENEYSVRARGGSSFAFSVYLCQQIVSFARVINAIVVTSASHALPLFLRLVITSRHSFS